MCIRDRSSPGDIGSWLQANANAGIFAAIAATALCFGAWRKRSRTACLGAASAGNLFSAQSSTRRRARTGSLQLSTDEGVPMTRMQSSHNPHGSCFSPTSPPPPQGFPSTGSCAQGLPSKGDAAPVGMVLQGLDASGVEGPVVQGMALTDSMSASAPPICVAGVAISELPRV